jgi:hypothetical protein
MGSSQSVVVGMDATTPAVRHGGRQENSFVETELGADADCREAPTSRQPPDGVLRHVQQAGDFGHANERFVRCLGRSRNRWH